jgi:hypothetical protein
VYNKGNDFRITAALEEHCPYKEGSAYTYQREKTRKSFRF